VPFALIVAFTFPSSPIIEFEEFKGTLQYFDESSSPSSWGGLSLLNPRGRLVSFSVSIGHSSLPAVILYTETNASRVTPEIWPILGGLGRTVKVHKKISPRPDFAVHRMRA